MDTRKLLEGGGTEQEFEAAMRTLAATIREAGECLLDLQNALEMLHMARQPSLALSVQIQMRTCLRRAMRPST